MWRNPQFFANLVTFTKEFLNGKPHFFVQYIRLFRSKYTLNATIFLPILIFANADVWIFRVDVFSEMKEILPQNTRTNLESYFDFVFRCEKLISLQNCEISYTGKYCDVRKCVQNKCSFLRYFFHTTSASK